MTNATNETPTQMIKRQYTAELAVQREILAWDIEDGDARRISRTKLNIIELMENTQADMEFAQEIERDAR